MYSLMGNHGGQVLYLATHRIREKVEEKVEDKKNSRGQG